MYHQIDQKCSNNQNCSNFFHQKCNKSLTKNVFKISPQNVSHNCWLHSWAKHYYSSGQFCDAVSVLDTVTVFVTLAGVTHVLKLHSVVVCGMLVWLYPQLFAWTFEVCKYDAVYLVLVIPCATRYMCGSQKQVCH